MEHSQKIEKKRKRRLKRKAAAKTRVQSFSITKLRKDISANAPSSLAELLTLSIEKLTYIDIGAMYLLATTGLPGSQTLRVSKVKKHLAIFDQLFTSIIVGISILCLLSHKIGNRHGFITFLRALVIMALVWTVGVLSYSGLKFSEDIIGLIIMFAVWTLVILLAMVLTSRQCRKCYSNLRFMFWLALWIVVVCMAILLVYFVIIVIGMKIAGNIPYKWIFMLLQCSFVSLIVGGCLYVIMLPFMILTLRSSFFHERLCACLHLESTSKTVSHLTEAGLLGGQKPDSEISKDGD